MFYIMENKYFYPDNLKSSYIFKYLSLRDIAIIACTFGIAMLIFLFLRVWIFFIIPIVYTIISIKIANYNITKWIILYMRYLITDELQIYWRKQYDEKRQTAEKEDKK